MEDTSKIIKQAIADDPSTNLRIIMLLLLVSIVQSDISRLKEKLGSDFNIRLREIGVDLDIVNEVDSYDISRNLKEINPYKVQTLYDTMSRHFRFEEDLLYYKGDYYE